MFAQPRRFLALASLLAAGCFHAATENPCSNSSVCAAGQQCISNKCVDVDGGGTGGGTAGSGGGVGTGGGTGGGSAGGVGGGVGTGGGTGTGGGSAGGVGGGTGGGAPTCGCVAVGQCVPGDSPAACGTDGGACAFCGMGQQCVAGGCVTAACGPGTCTGCCGQGFCVTPTMQTRFACGAGGNMCSNCPMGQVCTNGVCAAPPVCNATTCPTGCCDMAGQCQGGTMRFACGTGGAACTQCNGGRMCTNQACSGTLADGGVADAGQVGAPCGAAGAICATPICIPESSILGPTGFPGGYCSAQCGPAAACPGGAVCIPGFGGGGNCLAGCAGVGVQSTCRTGYVCAPDSATDGGTGYCRPNCGNGGLAQCQAPKTCNATTGLCN